MPTLSERLRAANQDVAAGPRLDEAAFQALSNVFGYAHALRLEIDFHSAPYESAAA